MVTAFRTAAQGRRLRIRTAPCCPVARAASAMTLAIAALVAATTACSPESAGGSPAADKSEAAGHDTGRASMARPAVDTSPARIARLVAVLPSANNTEAEAASDSLAAIGPTATAALIPVLEGNDIVARYFAVRAMVEYGPRAASAVPALTAIVERRIYDDRTQDLAVQALGNIGPDAAPAAPAIAALLAAPIHYSDPRYVFTALGRIGPGAASVLPTLVAHLGNAGVPTAVARVGGVGAVGRLEAALVDSAGQVVDVEAWLAEIAVALASLGDEGHAALNRALQAGRPATRAAVIAGYQSLGTSGVPRLAEVLDDGRPCAAEDFTGEPIACSVHAARALERLGTAARPALPALERTMRKSEDAETQDAVRRAMAAVRRDSGTP